MTKTTANTEMIEDYRTRNLTNKKYYVKVSGSKRRSHKSYCKKVAISKCKDLQSDIDNGIIAA